MLVCEISRPLFCEMVKEILARKAYIDGLYDDQRSRMGIYQIRCLADGRVYVGSAVNIRRRWSAHRCTLNGNNHYSRLLQRAWNEYGPKAFVWEILAYVYKSDLLLEIEDEYIERLKAADRRFGFNVKPSSERVSEETRKKISESHRGMKQSEESKRKQSQSRLGIPGPQHSQETVERIRKSNQNKKRSEETRQNMREAFRYRRPPTEEQKKRISESLKRTLAEKTGKKMNEEMKRKLLEANLGRKHSEESKQKRCEKMTGRKLSDEHKQKIRESWIIRKQKVKDGLTDGLI